MPARYLLDTNVLSEAMLAVPDPRVVKRLKAHFQEAVTAVVVWHELWFGVCRLPASRRRQDLERHLREVLAPTLPILPYDEKAAEWHARERSRLVAQGRTPPFADGQIAAITHTNGLTLVTRNVDDFAAFDGLHLQNWHR